MAGPRDENYDWSSFDLHLYYHAPLGDVWRAWATGRGLCSFFIEECRTVAPGGRALGPDEPFVAGAAYAWRWRHEASLDGEILTVEPERGLAFTFGDMRVDLTFTDTGNGVHVLLVQSGIPDTPSGRVGGHLNCRSCWLFFMTNLVSVLRHGADLRDEDPARVSSMEVGFVPAG